MKKAGVNPKISFCDLVSLGANHFAITSWASYGDSCITTNAGSCSFVTACMKLGRNCLAFETDGTSGCNSHLC
jgi:hypothetical protein